MKRFLSLAMCFALCLVASAAKAGIKIEYDFGNNGSVEFTDTDASDPLAPPGVNYFFGNGAGYTNSGLRVLLSGSLLEASDGTILSQTDVGGSTTTAGTSLTAVLVRITVDSLDLPSGSPLSLLSEVSGTSLFNTATNTSTVIGAPPGTATSSISGGLGADSGTAAGINRGGSTYTLVQELLITFAAGRVNFANTATSVVTAAIPEATSIIGWSLCVAVGAIAAYRRKRAA